MTGKQATLAFCAFFLAFAIGMGALHATKVIPSVDPTPADPWTNPSITTVIERPVTDIELVVGLAEIVTDQDHKIKRLTGELEQLQTEAQQIIRALLEEVQRLQQFEPAECEGTGPIFSV